MSKPILPCSCGAPWRYSLSPTERSIACTKCARYAPTPEDWNLDVIDAHELRECLDNLKGVMRGIRAIASHKDHNHNEQIIAIINDALGDKKEFMERLKRWGGASENGEEV